MREGQPLAKDPVQQVEPIDFPLYGNSLIEASAGTGKTYTIAALYLRLVLGSSGEGAARHEPARRALLPPEILVVTFTEAATLELRDRIRARLSEAAAFFRTGVEAQAGLDTEADVKADAFLRKLRDSFEPARWADCAIRLQLAAEWMDEAAIFTIHGWCNRMLSEHAFDSGGLFTQTLSTDTSELLAEACRDYWRIFCYPLGPADAGQWQGWWADPARLQQGIQQILDSLDAFGTDDLHPPAVSIGRARAQASAELAALKAPWREGWIDEVAKLLEEAVTKKRVDGRKIQRRFYEPWLEALRAWVDDESRRLPIENTSSSLYTRLTPGGMKEAWKDDEPPHHPAFEAMQALPSQIDALPDGRDEALLHAARWVDRRYRLARQQQGVLNFDDLLVQLRDALTDPGGRTLAARIRQQFPIALIDEFQDTDPVQYDIFDAVYRLSAAERGALPESGETQPTALILIGDPKQAIYAFRGADIFTYLRARRATEGRHFTLHRNYRSSTAMVEAANRLFEQAESRPGSRGAFRFAGEAGNPVPFLPVAAEGRSEHWRDEGHPAVALTIWYPDDGDPAHDGKTAYLDRYARATADEITRLLAAGQQGKAGFGDRDVVKPADIAVIVHTRRQADAVREALAWNGVRSVYLSDDESVFDSPVVDDLLRWLRACASPGDGRLLRAALGTGLSFQPADVLAQVVQDEQRWEERVRAFQGYREVWRRQGVLPMIRQLMQAFEVTERLLAAGRERELTDLLHLSELLQQASVLLQGEQALIRYLSEQRQQSDVAPDARRQRLESDDERVRLVTVHKSKGLEYPLVFFPFACHVRPVKPDDQVLRWHDQDGRLQSCLGGEAGSAEAVAKADEERLGEDLRKLYVALTRARHATWIGMAALKELPQSAIGHLLGMEALAAGPAARSVLRERLQALVDEANQAHQARQTERNEQNAADSLAPGCMALRPLPPESELRLSEWHEPDREMAAPLPLRSNRWPFWWIASYSSLREAAGSRTSPDQALAAGASEGAEEAGEQPAWALLDERFHAASALEDRWAEQAGLNHSIEVLEAREAQGGAEGQGVGPGEADDTCGRWAGRLAEPWLPLQDFPRGPQAGTFLHGLLEWAGREGFACLQAQPQRLDEAIGARLRRVPEWAAWQPVLRSWLQAVIGRSWPLASSHRPAQAPFRLSALVHYQMEMAFMLPVNQIPLRELDSWVSRHTLAGAGRPLLSKGQLNGMLKGFIDLVFEHEGRYFVLDYKSNWLGPDASHYSHATMQAAVLAHRYDLQYLFYCLALHRLLKNRLPDYDYDRHMGGAVYLFLRGMQGESGGVFFERPSRALIERLDDAFAGRATLEDL
ncbi:MAG: UvrD-helicase domain-containing protein [Lautropia sp.]|nr:UvrD-helicase domain-containing protein [Lautropia sp.]